MSLPERILPHHITDETPVADLTVGELWAVVASAASGGSASGDGRAGSPPSRPQPREKESEQGFLDAPRMLARKEAQQVLSFKTRKGFLRWAERHGVPKRLRCGQAKRAADGNAPVFFFSRELRDRQAYSDRIVRRDLASKAS